MENFSKNKPQTNETKTNKIEIETKIERKTENFFCFLSGKSKIVIVSAGILGVIILMLASFAGGIKVGSRKALFSCRWGENYEKNFIGPRPPSEHPGFFKPMLREFEGRDFRNAHGLAGTIISIADNTIAVRDKNNEEGSAAVSDKTIIKSGNTDLKLGDLKTDDKIVVMGRPGDNGVIEATLIRVFQGN